MYSTLRRLLGMTLVAGVLVACQPLADKNAPGADRRAIMPTPAATPQPTPVPRDDVLFADDFDDPERLGLRILTDAAFDNLLATKPRSAPLDDRSTALLDNR